MCISCGDGSCGGCGITVPVGPKGDSQVIYIAYANDNSGSGFSLTNGSLPFIAFFAADPGYTPVQNDFSGLWYRRNNNYVYIASANNSSGSGFTYPQNASQAYVGIIYSPTPLTPVVGDFAGSWRKVIGTDGTNGVIVLFNDVAGDTSGDTGGVTTTILNEVIPANTLVNNGDTVAIQMVFQCNYNFPATPPFIKAKVGGQLCGFNGFTVKGQTLVVDITVDRMDSSNFLLASKLTDSVGNTNTFAIVVGGVDFTSTITVETLANTTTNTGGYITLMKLYGEYKKAI